MALRLDGPQPMDFSLRRLENLYEMREEWSENYTFWRHDVDYSLYAAYEFARWERDRGYHGVYYLMEDSPFYDQWRGIELAQKLVVMGHGVGWHVDTRRTPIAEIARCTGDIVPVSFHCPRSYELWLPNYGFSCAYAAEWENSYYSDSRGVFAYGDPEDSHKRTLQINLHPEWWFEPDWHENVDPVVYEDFFYEPIDRLPARS